MILSPLQPVISSLTSLQHLSHIRSSSPTRAGPPLLFSSLLSLGFTIYLPHSIVYGVVTEYRYGIKVNIKRKICFSGKA